MNVTSRVSATGAESLSRGHKPVTANPAELPLWNFALPQPQVAHKPDRGRRRAGSATLSLTTLRGGYALKLPQRFSRHDVVCNLLDQEIGPCLRVGVGFEGRVIDAEFLVGCGGIACAGLWGGP